MREYAKNDGNDEPIGNITRPRSIRIDGTNYPRSIWDLWAASQLAEIGYYPVDRTTRKPDIWHSATYGWEFVNNIFIQTYSETLKDPSITQRKAQQIVDSHIQMLSGIAEQARRRWLTSEPIKQSVYRKKDEEVAYFNAATDAGDVPEPDDYPYAQSRATRKGVTLEEVIIEWEQIIVAVNMVGVEIEFSYEATKEALAAVTLDENIDSTIKPIMDEFYKMTTLLGDNIWADENGGEWEMASLPTIFTITRVP